MPQRLRLYDMRNSDLPEAVGLCVGDISGLARVCNRAELSLLNCKEAGDDGWWGTWAEVEFTASRTSPTIIMPREVARLESINVCGHTIQTNNQLYEYLQFGNGRRHHPLNPCRHRRCLPTMAYTRNNAVTQFEFGPAPQILSVFITNPADAGKRILLQGWDTSNNVITTQDVQNNVTGVYLVLGSPFVNAPMQFNRITGIQKDVTEGQVLVYQVDPVTGTQLLLLTMEPTEQTAWYRRYHLDPLPWNCCGTPSLDPTQNFVRCTAIAMLEHVDVTVDSDYLLIQDPNALIYQAQSNRMSKNDADSARAQSQQYHLDAVRSLIGQTSRYLGIDTPAIQFRPFGSATLARAGVGRRY